MTTDMEDIAEAYDRVKRAGCSTGDVGLATDAGGVTEMYLPPTAQI
jgi:hypothetical protein